MRNLILAAENLADHLSHFYLFFMPDFARAGYAARHWHAGAAQRFRAVQGTATTEALPARAGLLSLMGILAGKCPIPWPSSPVAARGRWSGPRPRLFVALREFRLFLERRLFGDGLEAVAALDGAAALDLGWRRAIAATSVVSWRLPPTCDWTRWAAAPIAS